MSTVRFGSRHTTDTRNSKGTGASKGTRRSEPLDADTAARLERIATSKPPDVRTRDEHARAVRREQKRRLAQRHKHGAVGLTEPDLTPPLAATFVKALYAGMPPLVALRYFAPTFYDLAAPKTRAEWLQRWTHSPLVDDANKRSIGGDWHELTGDERVRVAMDKHISELAYYLVSHRYADAIDDEQRKMVDARQALREHLKGLDAEKDKGVWAAMVRDILAGKATGTMIPDMPRHGDDEGPILVQKQIGSGDATRKGKGKGKMKTTLAVKAGPVTVTMEKKS